MVETFFFICCYCQIPIENVFLKRHFFPLLPKYSYVVSLFVEIPFHPSLSPLFWTWPWTKIKTTRKERCIESLTKNNPDYSFASHGNSREKHYRATNQMNNFYFRYKRKTVISPPILTIFHFYMCKGHTKTITIMSQKSTF